MSEPDELETVRLTEYVPGEVYVWLGFCAVDVPPSPKLHDQDVGLPDEVSVKATASGAGPLVGDAVKLATGGGGGVAVM